MFSDYLRGITEYEIKLESPESFVNTLKKDVPILWLDIPDEETVCIKCLYKDRESVEKCTEKRCGEITAKKHKGLPVFIKKLKLRLGLAAGCLLFVLAVYISSLFVWDIQVEGNEKLSENDVVKMLAKVGFCEGVIKNKIDVKSVADSVLINEDAVSWIAVNFDGTVARVEIKEALPAELVPKKQNVNLVAAANGIILRVDAHEGGTVIKKGDVVVKGQLLVSAFVDKRTGGSMLRGARGFVWANTERKIKVVVPYKYERKEYTGKLSREYGISFAGVKFALNNPFDSKGKTYDCDEKSSKLKLFENVVLPITVATKTKKEYKEYNSARTQKQALEIARLEAKERLYEISPKFTLTKTEEDYCEEDGKLVYACTFYGIENIAKELEFELS